MVTLHRHTDNPIIKPNPENIWEHDGAFNGCVVEVEGTFHMVYRALSSAQKLEDKELRISSVGHATSKDGIHFENHEALILPTEKWEQYGCEDPRITYLNGKFYIFYTALSIFPFEAKGIKLAVAVTKDFKTFEKHQVTPFNAKAMALFPDTVNGKLAALLTINTDYPPAKIAYVAFDREEDIWSPHFWEEWYENVNENLLHLMRDLRDQVELGSPPIKINDGWLVLYSYIENYLDQEKRQFAIEAMLLDLDDPLKIIGRTDYPLLLPRESYEMQGDVPNIIFPSGGLIKNNILFAYYGAADTCCALATCDVNQLLDTLRVPTHEKEHESTYVLKFQRFAENPIITPIPEFDWQAMGTFNPAAIYLEGKVHILYRAQAKDGTSTVGYASSIDGFHIDENLNEPIYVPREPFEQKAKPGNSGCEDPRITQIGDRLYILYTAYNNASPPRIALSSISVSDFLQKKWNWEKPKLISLPEVDDKDACIVKSKKTGKYLAFHRLGESIWLDQSDTLDFSEEKNLTGKVVAHPRKDEWDNVKLGIAAPPIETIEGWILLYHGVSHPGNYYKVGVMLLDLIDPTKVLARTDYSLLDPDMAYELQGQVPNVVFPCGAVVIDDTIFLYYGGGDSVTGVATISLPKLLMLLKGTYAL